MRVKFAYAVFIAAAVAMLTACSKKNDGEASAGASAATAAVAFASDATIGRIGHAARLTGTIVHLGKDNENGARLAIVAINRQGLTTDGQKIQLELDAQDDAADPKTGTQVAQKRGDDHVIAAAGHLDEATAYGKGLADEFAETAQASGAKIVAREATNDQATDYRAILTGIKRVQPDVIMDGGMDATGGPLATQAAAPGIGAKILGGDGVCTDKVGELAGSAVQNLVCSKAECAFEDGQGSGLREDVRRPFQHAGADLRAVHV